VHATASFLNEYGSPSICSVFQFLYFFPLHIIYKKEPEFNFSVTRFVSTFLVLNFSWSLLKYYIDGNILYYYLISGAWTLSK
jgi:hypothetical protein